MDTFYALIIKRNELQLKYKTFESFDELLDEIRNFYGTISQKYHGGLMVEIHTIQILHGESSDADIHEAWDIDDDDDDDEWISESDYDDYD